MRGPFTGLHGKEHRQHGLASVFVFEGFDPRLFVQSTRNEDKPRDYRLVTAKTIEMAWGPRMTSISRGFDKTWSLQAL